MSDALKDFSFLSPKYDSLFSNNIEVFCSNMKKKNSRYRHKQYCVFYPSFGCSDKAEIKFIIYGQAASGWHKEIPGFTIQDCTLLLAENARLHSNTLDQHKKSTPLDWVNLHWNNPKIPYKTYRSFFWNVVKKLAADMAKIDRASGEWCKHIIYSNLMKIAPAYPIRRNPNHIEKQAQLELSKQLFKMELKEIGPRIAILLTNKTWADPFIINSGTPIDYSTSNKEFIQWVGFFDRTLLIVSKRPYPNGNSEKCVKEIRELIKCQLA